MAGAIILAFPFKLLWVHLTHKYNCCRPRSTKNTEITATLTPEPTGTTYLVN